MAKIDYSHLNCPSCKGHLTPRVVICETCDLKLEGDFKNPNLGQLSGEHLQFIQLFIHCEGSIREMEKALGVSYPTVKARLAEVKAALEPATIAKPISPKPAKKDLAAVLSDLQAGQIPFDEALKQIRKLKNQT